MARRLMVSEAGIHRTLARLGLRRRTPASAELPWPDDFDASLGKEHVDQSDLLSHGAEGEAPEALGAPAQLETSPLEEPLDEEVSREISPHLEPAADPPRKV